MAKKTKVFQHAFTVLGQCAITCSVDRCPYTTPAADWLNDLVSSHDQGRLLDWRFQVDPDPNKHCVYVLAELEYLV